MRCLLRPSLLLCLGLTVAVPIATHAAAQPTADARDDGDDEFVGDEAYFKLKLTHGGKTRTHPGYLAVTDEEMILSMEQGERTHEISIVLARSEEGQWNAKVAYKVGDKTVVTGARDIATKKWLKFKSEDGKSVVEIHVDPDSKGGETLDLGKGNKPLDGLQ